MENEEMTNDAAVAWRIRIGDSHTWGFTSDEDDADFHGKNSGLRYVKEALVPATTVAELRAEVERKSILIEQFMDKWAEEVRRADAAERRVAELTGLLSDTAGNLRRMANDEFADCDQVRLEHVVNRIEHSLTLRQEKPE